MNYTNTKNILFNLISKKQEESCSTCTQVSRYILDRDIKELTVVLKNLDKLKKLVPNEFEQDDLGNIL